MHSDSKLRNSILEAQIKTHFPYFYPLMVERIPRLLKYGEKTCIIDFKKVSILKSIFSFARSNCSCDMIAQSATFADQ